MSTQRLLSPRHSSESNEDFDEAETRPQSSSSHHAHSPGRPPIIALPAMLLLTALVGMAARLMELPLNRAIELRYCQQYYAAHDPSIIGHDGFIPESLCKVNEVQQSLGWMQGVLSTVANICDIAVTVPMGLVIDRLGPRLALLLNLSAVAVFLSWIALVGKLWTVFPINALLAAPVLSLYGGGTCVARMAGLAMVTEIAQTDQRLPTYLAYVSSAEYVVSLASPPLSAFLLTRSLWLPFWVGLVCLGSAAPLIALLPQTGTHLERTSSVRSERPDSAPRHETTLLLASPSSSPVYDKPMKSSKSLRTLLRGYRSLITRSRAFQILLGVFVIRGSASSTNVMLLQYISKRYGWPFAKVGYVFTVKAAVNIFLLTIVVPAWTRVGSTRLNLTPFRTDMIGGKAALIAATGGAALIGSSSTVWLLVAALIIYASGSVAPVFLYALAKSAAVGNTLQEHQGKAFALIVLCSSCGELIGLPAATAIWVRAIKFGGTGLGLPYHFSSALYALATLALWCVRYSGLQRDSVSAEGTAPPHLDDGATATP